MSMLTSIARAVVSLVSDSGLWQSLQLRVLKDETLDDVERVQQYGFTSVPKAPSAAGAAEAVVVFMGDRSSGVVIAVDDRRYRLKSLAAGEVAIYDDLGQKVHLTRTKIVIKPKVGNTVEIGDEGLGALDGVVHGSGIDPFTGLTYTALGNASAVVKAKK